MLESSMQRTPSSDDLTRIVCWSHIVGCRWVETDDFQVGLTETILPLAGLISNYENIEKLEVAHTPFAQNLLQSVSSVAILTVAATCILWLGVGKDYRVRPEISP